MKNRFLNLIQFENSDTKSSYIMRTLFITSRDIQRKGHIALLTTSHFLLISNIIFRCDYNEDTIHPWAVIFGYNTRLM